MKNSIKQIFLASLALVALGLGGLNAMPKYTDKQTAIALAKVLDKGSFGRYTVASTYVQNASNKDYYISVILSNGESQKWNLKQIYKWSRDDKLTLSNNRTLLFLDPKDSRFVILDKNEFHRQALKANVYIKTFGPGDPLEGRQFRFHIKAFNLISPRETAFGRNKMGSKYRYIIDLYNGTKELLTFEDAYHIMKNNLLKVEKQSKQTTFGRAYHVTKILAYPKGKIENGVAQFGVEVQFDQNIQLTGEQFPMEIYEDVTYNPRTKRREARFVMDLTIPNAEKLAEVAPIHSLEYLYNIRIAKSTKYPKRLYLRANFNPEFLDIPPVVYKNSDNSVYINFFTMLDQSVLTRSTLLHKKKLERVKKKTKRAIRVKKEIKRDSDYGRAFVAALESQKQVQIIQGTPAKVEKLLEGIRQFEEAALYAETDQQLYASLNKRNELREKVILLTLEEVEETLGQPDLDNNKVKVLLDQLDLAESFSGNEQSLRNIVELREKLIALQK